MGNSALVITSALRDNGASTGQRGERTAGPLQDRRIHGHARALEFLLDERRSHVGDGDNEATHLIELVQRHVIVDVRLQHPLTNGACDAILEEKRRHLWVSLSLWRGVDVRRDARRSAGRRVPVVVLQVQAHKAAGRALWRERHSPIHHATRL